jgi:hypothetical protein
MFVVAVPLQIAWMLFWERPQPPMNAFLAWPSDQTADLLEGAQSIGLWAVSAGLVGLTVMRWRSAAWPGRRALAPVLPVFKRHLSPTALATEIGGRLVFEGSAFVAAYRG